MAGIWLVGCGNMGSALLARWRAAGIDDVAVIDPAIAGAAGVPDGVPDVVVLAVKPQVWREAAAAVVGRTGAGTLIVSVMAGVTLAALGAVFAGRALLRAMPNTPAAIGQGVTALLTNGDPQGASAARAAGEALFQPAGATVWLEDEADFDAVTALAGSGPGYVFAFVEALAAAGVAAGLEAGLAMRLARATVTGAAALAAADAAPVDELRARVTSPGGTTAAGLAVLVPGLAPLLAATVAAAAARSRELGG